jgi:hypothetical protein
MIKYSNNVEKEKLTKKVRKKFLLKTPGAAHPQKR